MSTTKTADRTSNRTELQARLLRRIIKHSSMDEDQIADAGRHGADAGWPGFTYHKDTLEFFKANRADIVALVNDMAEQMGESAIDMVAGFQCLAGRELQQKYGHTCQYGSDDARTARGKRQLLEEYYPAISRALYGGNIKGDVDVPNALAWFALEEIGRMLADERDND